MGDWRLVGIIKTKRELERGLQRLEETHCFVTPLAKRRVYTSVKDSTSYLARGVRNIVLNI